MDMIAELRELLDVEPSMAAFRKVWTHLEQSLIKRSKDGRSSLIPCGHTDSVDGFAAQQVGEQDHEWMMALEYAEQHMESWPDEARQWQFQRELHPGVPTPLWVLLCHVPYNWLTLRGRGAFASLAESPYTKNLVQISLSLSHGRVSDNDIRAYAQSHSLTKLKILDLRRNPITIDGAIALAESPIVSSLEVLRLDNTKIMSVGWRILANSPYLKDKVASTFVDKLAAYDFMIAGMRGIRQG